MKKLLACGTLWLMVASPAWTAQQYTPEQLRQMVGAGTFPAHEDAAEETRAVPFWKCKAVVQSLVADVQPDYPVHTLADGPSLLSVKLWTNDAAVTLSCSQDDRMVVQRYLYR